MTELHEKPTSEWKHSHALERGQELVTERGYTMVVDWIDVDGTVYYEDGNRHREDDVRRMLKDGALETPDGLSHELTAR